MTELAKRCLASWKKFAPGWEIKLWKSEDFGLKGPFIEECRAKKLWGFVSDPVRYAALCEYGGVYLDLDVELVGSLESLGSFEWVASEEGVRGETWVNPGSGIALEKGSPFAKRMIDYYATHKWEGKTGGQIFAQVNGERMVDGLPTISGLRVLPKDIMSPIGIDGKLRKTERTVGIHWYAGSWFTKKQKVVRWLSRHGFQWLINLRLKFISHVEVKRGRKDPLKILYQWTGLTSYQGDCWRAMNNRAEIKVVVAVRGRDGVDFKAEEVLHGLDYLVIDESDKISVSVAEEKIKAWLGDWTPDVIYAAGWYNPVTKAVAYGKTWDRVPKVCGVDMPWRNTLKCWLAPLFLRRYAKRFKACYVPGAFCRKYCQWIGFKNIHTGLYAIDIKRFAASAAGSSLRTPTLEYQADPSSGTSALPRPLVYIGRQSQEKRVDLLEKGYEIYRRNGGVLPLKMYGKGCRDGFVRPEDVPGIMQNAAALVLCSDFDPWPLVLLEATASKCPVVASDKCTNYPELGRDWTIFKHGDKESLAAALLKIKPNTLDVSEYGCEKWVERTLKIFEEAAAK